jgi:hypothetical protein
MQSATLIAMKQPITYDHTDPVPAVAMTTVPTMSSDPIGVMSARARPTLFQKLSRRRSSCL